MNETEIFPIQTLYEQMLYSQAILLRENILHW